MDMFGWRLRARAKKQPGLPVTVRHSMGAIRGGGSCVESRDSTDIGDIHDAADNLP